MRAGLRPRPACTAETSAGAERTRLPEKRLLAIVETAFGSMKLGKNISIAPPLANKTPIGLEPPTAVLFRNVSDVA